mgnify:CR=1 FL=1
MLYNHTVLYLSTTDWTIQPMTNHNNIDITSVSTYDDTTADTYDAYFQSIDSTCHQFSDLQLTMTKPLLSFTPTQRDEIRLALQNRLRLPVLCVRVIEDGEFELDVRSTIPVKKDKKEVENSRKRKTTTTDTTTTTTAIAAVDDDDSLVVLDPVKLIHGGFVPTSVKHAQREASSFVRGLMDVLNSRERVLKELADNKVKEELEKTPSK